MSKAANGSVVLAAGADMAHEPASTFAHEMKTVKNTTAIFHLRVSSRFISSPRPLYMESTSS